MDMFNTVADGRDCSVGGCMNVTSRYQLNRSNAVLMRVFVLYEGVKRRKRSCAWGKGGRYVNNFFCLGETRYPCGARYRVLGSETVPRSLLVYRHSVVREVLLWGRPRRVPEFGLGYFIFGFCWGVCVLYTYRTVLDCVWGVGTMDSAQRPLVIFRTGVGKTMFGLVGSTGVAAQLPSKLMLVCLLYCGVQ